MSLVDIDAMVDFAIARIAETPDGYRMAVRDLVRGWPDASGLQIVFVLVSAANAIERVFPKGHAGRQNTKDALRMAALLGTDLFALQQRGIPAATGRYLLTYWDEVDPYFRDF